jgi:hypothetical protein
MQIYLTFPNFDEFATQCVANVEDNATKGDV